MARERAGQATRALVEAVRAVPAELPEKERPRLVVLGESRGASAVEESFGGLDELPAAVDGALLVGPPGSAPIRAEVTGDRAPGSPVWRPVHDRGRHVRFSQYPEHDLRRPGPGAWEHPRGVYLQNASDPIVWWSWEPAVRRPQWLEKPLGPEVTDEVDWLPFGTFWQTAVDMAVSYGVGAPHGHRYGTSAVEGWSAVAPPEGWTHRDGLRLEDFAEARDAPC